MTDTNYAVPHGTTLGCAAYNDVQGIRHCEEPSAFCLLPSAFCLLLSAFSKPLAGFKTTARVSACSKPLQRLVVFML
ncbi:MAG: hypothetical protein LBD53_09545 [Tannerella sp.]|nr:hypothetical protein [Tannerella sp.]